MSPQVVNTFLVYGSFTLPEGINFCVCRYTQAKGVRWQRDIAPGLARLVKRITATPKHKAAPYWNVDGEVGSVWDSGKSGARRYEWDGAEFTEVPR